MAFAILLCKGSVMRNFNIFLCSVFLVFLMGCSSSEEQTKKENENEIQKEEYVFDASEVDSIPTTPKVEVSAPQTETAKKFVVQIGAFTTKTSADDYAALAKKRLSKEIIVSFSEEFKLYVVQLKPFASKSEAESVRNELWKSKNYKDAFIVVNP